MKIKTIAGIILSLFISSHCVAATITVNFGNFFFNPKTVDVKVGDVIMWMGDFTMHQIQSTSVPTGAESFGPTVVGSEASFSYTVKVPGQYNYQCNFHFAQGMIGSFTATAESNDVNPISSNVSDAQNFPNPFKTNTTIRYTLSNSAEIDLRFFNLSGKEIHHISSPLQLAGVHEISLNSGSLPSGVYYYRLQVGDAVLTRQMILAK